MTLKVEAYIASGILERYVLDELSPVEAFQVEKMAAQYPEVQKEIQLIQETLESMAFELSRKPSPRVLEKVMDKIDRKQQANSKLELPQKKKKITYLQYGIAATFTLKLVAMAIAASFFVRWKATEQELGQLRKQYYTLEQKANQATRILLAVSDPEVQTIVLTRQDNPEQRTLLYWNPVTKKIYINTENLPRNDKRHQYQIWGMTQGNPESLGVFDVTADQLLQLLVMEGNEKLMGFAITLEPTGGSTKPTLTRLYGEGKIE